MTIKRLEFGSLEEMQTAFFIDRFGFERGNKLVNIMINAARSFGSRTSDQYGYGHSSLPYYLHAISTINKLGDISSFLPPAMQNVLSQPQIDASGFDGNPHSSKTIKIISDSFWTRPDINVILNDYIEAAKTQADLTQRYFMERSGYVDEDRNVLVFRPNRKMDHPMSAYNDLDPMRLVFGATLEQKIAQRYAGVTSVAVRRRVPVNLMLDSYLTNVSFNSAEYEVLYLRLPVF